MRIRYQIYQFRFCYMALHAAGLNKSHLEKAVKNGVFLSYESMFAAYYQEVFFRPGVLHKTHLMLECLLGLLFREFIVLGPPVPSLCS